jgi:transcriptional regulator with XRE-family HTH domain
MAEKKLFAGGRIRRLRRSSGFTQSAMAETLDISASYLNLIERNQRPLTAALMLRLAELFDFDPRSLAAEEPGGGAEAIRRRLADPLFADLAVDRTEIEEWLAASTGCARPGHPDRSRMSIRSPRRGGKSSGGATISPISTRRPRRWRMSCVLARAISTARLPSGCG